MLAVFQKEHRGVIGKFSSRLIIDGGPLINGNNTEALKLILNECNRVAKNKAVFTLYRNYWKWNDDLIEVFLELGYKYEDQLDIIIRVDEDIDQILSRFNSNLKRNITKSKNKGVVFHEVTDIKTYKDSLALVKNTYKRVKLPIPHESLFLNAFEFLYPKSMLRSFVAFFENKMIGVRIELIYKGLIFDWYAGHDEIFNNKYPNDFLIYNILRWGTMEKSLLEFDFGGAGKKGVPYGVRDYKSKFGGELIEFGRFLKINKPLTFKFSKLGFYLFKQIIKYGLRSENKY